jgi:hypothetical protein
MKKAAVAAVKPKKEAPKELSARDKALQVDSQLAGSQGCQCMQACRPHCQCHQQPHAAHMALYPEGNLVSGD